jgi:hypothetical protein
MLLAYLLYKWVKKLLRAQSPRPAFGRGEKVSGGFQARQPSRSSEMIRCNACEMFITRSSAFMSGDGVFCSKTCFENRLRKA